MRVDLGKSLFILPNLFTLSSVLCGYYAIVICTEQPNSDDLYRAAMLIVFAMFFDTIDGRVARLTKTQSAVGVQLDSLADLVSFGVAPAILVYHWSLQDFGPAGILVGFVYVAAGAIRLARFNLHATDDKGTVEAPSKYIVGLPIPAAAGILISLVVASKFTERLPFAPAIIAALVVGLAVFMVSTVRFRSFKGVRLSWRSVIFVSIALGLTAFLSLKFHPSIALVWLLVSYIAIAILEGLFGLVVRPRENSDPPKANDARRP